MGETEQGIYQEENNSTGKIPLTFLTNLITIDMQTGDGVLPSGDKLPVEQVILYEALASGRETTEETAEVIYGKVNGLTTSRTGIHRHLLKVALEQNGLTIGDTFQDGSKTRKRFFLQPYEKEPTGGIDKALASAESGDEMDTDSVTDSSLQKAPSQQTPTKGMVLYAINQKGELVYSRQKADMSRPIFGRLTKRRQVVKDLLNEGKTIKDIAFGLGVSSDIIYYDIFRLKQAGELPTRSTETQKE